MKKALILGGGGFIGYHMTKRLKAEGYYVTAIDLKQNEFAVSHADEFIIADLRNIESFEGLAKKHYDELYQFAADMGGAGYVFVGQYDADIMHNSSMINLNVLQCFKNTKTKLFYASSACVYPEENQKDYLKPNCAEDSAYPANPDSEYGWEKLFSERLFFSFARNYKVDVRVARFHNIFGPYGSFAGGKEKAPAAICRKVITAKEGEAIEIWGSGKQTRSFLYVDECIEGIRRLMNSDFKGPVNIGSNHLISINNLTQLIIDISGKNLTIKNVDGPIGVNGRCSDNKLIENHLNWSPKDHLESGILNLYTWITTQISE